MAQLIKKYYKNVYGSMPDTNRTKEIFKTNISDEWL